MSSNIHYFTDPETGKPSTVERDGTTVVAHVAGIEIDRQEYPTEVEAAAAYATWVQDRPRPGDVIDVGLVDGGTATLTVVSASDFDGGWAIAGHDPHGAFGTYSVERGDVDYLKRVAA
jgi:hypothetical protein